MLKRMTADKWPGKILSAAEQFRKTDQVTASFNTMNRKTKKWLLIASPVVVLILIPGYYQFFYQSKQVRGNYVQLNQFYKGHRHIVNGVQFSPDGRLVASAGVDSTLQIWQTADGRMLKTIAHPAGITGLEWSAASNLLITSSYDGKVRAWNAGDGKLVHELMGHQGTVWTVAISRDGKHIASAGEDKTIRIWDAVTGNMLRSLSGHKRNIWAVRFNPEGSKLASCGFDFTAKIWSVADGRLLHDLTDHEETVVALAFSPDGHKLATTSDDATIKIWNTADFRLLQSLEEGPEHVQAVAWSPDGYRLITGGRDKPMIGELLQNFIGDSKMNKGVSMRLWDVSKGALIQTFSLHQNDVNDLAWSPDGRWIASASADRTVGLWKVVR